MKRFGRALLAVSLISLLIFSGCTEQPQPSTAEKLYVCPTGEMVSDPELCPGVTETPVSSPTSPPMMTQAPITTAAPPPHTTAAPTTTAEPYEPPSILVVIDPVQVPGPGGEFWFDGKLRNNGETVIYNAQVRLTLYDEFNKVMEIKNSVPITELKPGETAPFIRIKLKTLISRVSRYEIETIYQEEP